MRFKASILNFRRADPVIKKQVHIVTCTKLLDPSAIALRTMINVSIIIDF